MFVGSQIDLTHYRGWFSIQIGVAVSRESTFPREVRTTANISRISAGSLPAGSIEFKVEENVIKGEKIVAITPDGL
jgi:hypothetical protein